MLRIFWKLFSSKQDWKWISIHDREPRQTKLLFFQMLLLHFTEFFEAIWHNFVISTNASFKNDYIMLWNTLNTKVWNCNQVSIDKTTRSNLFHLSIGICYITKWLIPLWNHFYKVLVFRNTTKCQLTKQQVQTCFICQLAFVALRND